MHSNRGGTSNFIHFLEVAHAQANFLYIMMLYESY